MKVIRTLLDTITIFHPYGIRDGRLLVSKTVQELEQAAPPPDSNRDHQLSKLRGLNQAFKNAYTTEASIPIVPEALDCAIEAAATRTVHTYLGEEASVDTEVVPTFYRHVVSFFRSFIQFGADPVAGIYLDRPGEGELR